MNIKFGFFFLFARMEKFYSTPFSGAVPRFIVKDSMNMAKRIEGGVKAEEGRYPYVATIFSENPFKYFVYGTLIDPSWVITKRLPDSLMDDEIDIYVSLNNDKSIVIKYFKELFGFTSDPLNEKVEKIKVKNVIVHPSYDFALVELEKASSSSYIKYLSNEQIPLNTTLTAVGWRDVGKVVLDFSFGLNGDGYNYEDYSEELKETLETMDESLYEVELKTKDTFQCVKEIFEFLNGPDFDGDTEYPSDDEGIEEYIVTNKPETMICVDSDENDGLCSYDSGVPIIMKGSNIEEDVLLGTGYGGFCGFAGSLIDDVLFLRQWISETTSPPTESSSQAPTESPSDITNVNDAVVSFLESLTEVADAIVAILTCTF